MKKEQITWHAVADCLPDSDMTVMVYSELWDDPIFMGWHDGDDGWRNIHAENIQPTHWADLPQGPKIEAFHPWQFTQRICEHRTIYTAEFLGCALQLSGDRNTLTITGENQEVETFFRLGGDIFSSNDDCVVSPIRDWSDDDFCAVEAAIAALKEGGPQP